MNIRCRNASDDVFQIYTSLLPGDRLSPIPVLARTLEEVLSAKRVEPTLSPNHNTLALVEVIMPSINDFAEYIDGGSQLK
ncbi:7-hydroxymethyl chlorophyll a reductase, chloroplastic [Tanacetum coccineum]